MYTVYWSDNAHGPASEGRPVGDFETYEEALAAARKVIEDSVKAAYRPGAGAAVLSSYRSFGEDAWIVPDDGDPKFSGWEYAEEVCRALCGAEEPGPARPGSLPVGKEDPHEGSGMRQLISLLERLAAGEAPPVETLGTLLATDLDFSRRESEHWRFHEARAASGPVERVDLRVPTAANPGASPLLVLTLRDGVLRLDELAKCCETPVPSDVSAHHPDFTGYTLHVSGRPIGVTARVPTGEVLSISIDYAKRR